MLVGGVVSLDELIKECYLGANILPALALQIASIGFVEWEHYYLLFIDQRSMLFR